MTRPSTPSRSTRASAGPAPPRRRGPRRYWLFKTEPGVFSFEDLGAAPGRAAGWDGVRNHQARNYLRDDVRVGDGVLVYHSSADPSGVAGIAVVTRAAAPDPTQFDPRSEGYDPRSRPAAPTWVQVELRAVAPAQTFVTLAALRAAPELQGMALLRRGQRLSILPVTPPEWEAVLRLAGLDPRRC